MIIATTSRTAKTIIESNKRSLYLSTPFIHLHHKFVERGDHNYISSTTLFGGNPPMYFINLFFSNRFFHLLIVLGSLPLTSAIA